MTCRLRRVFNGVAGVLLVAPGVLRVQSYEQGRPDRCPECPTAPQAKEAP